MTDTINSFRDLEVWKVACDLAEKAYRVTAGFPKQEAYGLTDQMRRAAVSVPSNIAEGAGRLGPTEYRHFLSIALGSLAELRTQAELSRRFRYLTDEQAQDLDRDITRVESMTWKLHRSLGQPR
jgi:four helix bundle protein